MKKVKLKCVTPYPEIRVEGYGAYKKDDEVSFPENLAGELLQTLDWKRVKEKPEKEVKDALQKKEGKKGEVKEEIKEEIQIK